MKKKLGDLTLRELKEKCNKDKYECDICDYCNFKPICYSKVWRLMYFLDQEIEVEENGD